MPEEYFAINHSMSRRTPSTMDSAGILADVVAMNGAKGTITLGTGTWRIDLATTIPANARLVIEQGAMLTKYGSGTLTINGPFEAPLAQVFSGFAVGDVTFSEIMDVRPEWFGANDTSDSATALNSALAACPHGGTVVFSRLYSAASPVEMPSGKSIALRAWNMPITITAAPFGSTEWDTAVFRGCGIRSSVTSGSILSMTSVGSSVSDLLIVGPGTGTAAGLYAHDGQVKISGIVACNCYSGLSLNNVEVSSVILPVLRGCITGIFGANSCNANTFLSIDITACGTGIGGGFAGSKFIGGAIQGCSSYGVTGDFDECLFDGIWFENSATTAAIYFPYSDYGHNKIAHCHQGYENNDSFIINSKLNDIELHTHYAKAVVLGATSVGNRVRASGYPEGSSDAGQGNLFILDYDGGIEYRAGASSNTQGAIRMGGDNYSAMYLNTSGGMILGFESRDDLAGGRWHDGANNNDFIRVTPGDNPAIAFLGAAPVTRPTVTGSKSANAALASLLTALADLGLITDSST